MTIPDNFHIYEFFDQNGDPSQFICDGHVDSTTFRNKCVQDFSLSPLVVRHQWQKMRKVIESRPGKKKKLAVTKTIYSAHEVFGARPVTIGLL